MTIFYPDISAFNPGVSLAGALAVCAKVTEGTSWVSGVYSAQRANASSHGAYFFAYHFLHQGSGASQAQWCFSHADKTPLMLDVEAEGTSNPGVADTTAFVDEYRRLGGLVNLVYLPQWYWSGHIGSPSLAPLVSRNLALVSSAYVPYSDKGSGWASYGGMTPKIWQYTDSVQFGGFSLDFNAFKGSGKPDVMTTLAELKSIVQTGQLPSKYATNPVQGLRATPRYTQADLSWGKVPGATGYRVVVKEGSKRVSTQVVPGNEWTLHGLHEKTVYTVSVLALPASPLATIAGRAKAAFATK